VYVERPFLKKSIVSRKYKIRHTNAAKCRWRGCSPEKVKALEDMALRRIFGLTKTKIVLSVPRLGFESGTSHYVFE
jgi:hypothetical protein